MITIENLSIIIKDKFQELCNKYNINNCELIICNWNEYINDRYNKRYKKYDRGAKQLLWDINNDSNLYIHSFAHHIYDIIDDTHVIHSIYIPEENLRKLAYNEIIFNQPSREEISRNSTEFKTRVKITNEDITNFLCNVISHELGHVIHTNKILKRRGVEDGTEYLNKKNREGLDRYYKYMERLNESYSNDYEFYNKSYTKYHSMYCEKEADKAVGLDINNTLDSTLKVELGFEKL